MISRFKFTLPPKERGFHIITDEVENKLPSIDGDGLLHVFICHTSAGITLNENTDPQVLEDFEFLFSRLVPENLPGLKHTLEGPDDMPAHIKASLIGQSVSIPISKGKLDLGTWQGIILGEFRNQAKARNFTGTLIN